jgi:two-component system, chemotaxis family, sensor kinase Cph1
VHKAFATVIVASIDPATGQVEAASAGHLMPYLTNGTAAAVPAPVRLSPPVGAREMVAAPSEFVIEPGQTLVMYSDGLVERRGQSIDDGLARLATTLARVGDVPAADIWTAMASGNTGNIDTDDDVTILTLRRR